VTSAATGPVAAREVTGIAIKTQPSNLSYVEGQALDLSGLEVTLSYNVGSAEDVAFTDFGTKNLTTDPANGTILSIAGHHDKPVAVSCNNKTAHTDKLTVVAREVTGIAVKTQPTKLSYIEGQALDFSGLEVTLTYNDGTEETVASADFGSKNITTNPANGTALSIDGHNGQPVKVICNGLTAYTNNLTVVAKAVEGIAVKTQPTKLSYVEGQALDLSGLEVTLTYNDGSAEDVAFTDFGAKNITTDPANGTNLSIAGHHDKPVAVSCNNKTAHTDKLTVVAREVTGIAIKTQPTKLIYVEGQSLDLSGLEVTLTYNDGSNEEVAFAGFGTKGITTTPAQGVALAITDNKVTITHTESGKSVELTITVAAKAVENIAIKTQPTKLSYVEGQALDLSGLEVTLTFNDNSTEEVALADFGSKSITTDPANGTALTIAGHHDKPVAVSCNNKTAHTDNLTVVAREVTGIAIKTQPTKLSYVEGQALDLSGLEVTLTYNDGTEETVASADFGNKNITTDPANGTALSIDGHNGQPVEVICNGLTAYTNNLTVVDLSGLAIEGDAVVGGTLAATGIIPANAPVDYQWLRNGAPIEGATGKTYTLRDADIGRHISVTVTWGEESQSSAETELVRKGDGSETNPYAVATAEQLDTFVRDIIENNPNLHFEQIEDIDLSAYGDWIPLPKFSGVFDGKGNTIRNLTIDLPTCDLVGLFSQLSGGVLKNIKLKNVNVTGNASVGGLVGRSGENSTIHNYYVTGKVSGHSYVGGLVGALDNSTIYDSYTTCGVSGNDYVGGLVGSSFSSSTTYNSYATGNVFGNRYVGGLVGRNEDNSTIRNTYATGNVSGNNFVGGLVGLNYNGSTIKDSYATGDVSGTSNVGGLVGFMEQGDSTIESSYATGYVSGNDYVGGLVGHMNESSVTASYYDRETSKKSDTGKGEPRTTQQMITGTPDSDSWINEEPIYEDWDTAIWDFGDDHDYPTLIGLPGQEGTSVFVLGTAVVG
jgi:nitrate reductase NapAB chaperone NapD